VIPRLFTPGPVEIPDRILSAMAKRPPHHRSTIFRELYAALTPRLNRLFDTSGRVVVLAASGTGGMDAAVTGFVGDSTPTLSTEAGKFGDRWEKILRCYGHQPHVVRAEWGTAVAAGEIGRALDEHPAEVVFLTHSETSTATLHDLKAQAAEARSRGALVVADVVTSLGVHEFRQDEFGIDVAVAGSQKGLMLPPGLALVGLSERALARLESDGVRGSAFYLDLKRAADSAVTGDTPFTPAVSLVLALDEAVKMIEELGIEEVWRRHDALASAIRAGGVAAGMQLFSRSPANSVTAFSAPEGVEANQVVAYLGLHHGFVLAGGQDHLKGKIARVGHMGLAYGPEDARQVTAALEEAVIELGGGGEKGRAAQAVEESLGQKPCGSL
jgi:aspartate aminotransferase-like enzyme